MNKDQAMNRGAWRTNALFLETCMGDEEFCVFTLGREDIEKNGKVYPSLHRLYMESDDPTEYEISKVFYSAKHWERVSTSQRVSPYIEEFRMELALKIKSLGVKKIMKDALSTKPSFPSAKYLADTGWIDGKTKKNRDMKQKLQAQVMDEFQSDLDRISKH